MPELTDKDRELVLAVRAGDVADLFGVHARRLWYPVQDEAEVDAWLDKATVAFLPRSIAENDEGWRHFATYSVLRDGDRVFTYRRGASGSEGRLHGRRSLGVGGHAGLDDYDHRDGFGSRTFHSAALRELCEEVDVPFGTHFGLDGLIADDSTPVNRVHLGVVYGLEVNAGRVYPREDCLADPAWLTTAELHERRGEFETWSQIVIDRLIGGAA